MSMDEGYNIGGMDWVVPGQLARPRVAQNSEDLRDFAKVQPDWMEQIRFAESLPEIPIKRLKQNDVVAMRTESGERYGFIVDDVQEISNSKSSKARGGMILAPRIASHMGVPGIVDNAVIYGACPEGSKTLYMGVIKRGMGVETCIPVGSLGPIIDEKDLKTSYTFDIPSLDSAGIRNLSALPSPDEASGSSSFLKDKQQPEYLTRDKEEVPDWPGKGLGVTKEDIDFTLYTASGAKTPGLGIRGRYWVNPETGSMTKQGRPMEGTVWDIVNFYAHEYQKSGSDFSAKRAAAFSYWALKLGLKPPQEVLDELKGCGLGFSTRVEKKGQSRLDENVTEQKQISL
jgi:hypothetical protein